jgi:hypothetical protein
MPVIALGAKVLGEQESFFPRAYRFRIDLLKWTIVVKLSLQLDHNNALAILKLRLLYMYLL